MIVKDYYKILELPPQATVKEVKKNFRRLALRYHPDTNPGNRHAEAWYHEIQEAYETLIDDDLRETYHQQRWLLKSQGRKFAESLPVTPSFILQQCNELREQVRNMDHFRMSHASLQQQLLFVVRDENIEALLAYNETATNRSVSQSIISAMDPLEYPLLHPVIKQLYRLSKIDKQIHDLLESYERRRKQEYLWEKYQSLIILAITVLLCVGIYFLGR
jgi:curved DNA-binding protein CbpA